MTNWQERLRAAGYAGELELGAMIKTLPRYYKRGQFVLREYGPLNGISWYAEYWDNNELLLHASDYSDTPEEAVADLMIEHPELWKK